MSDLVERLRGILAKATSGPFTADRDLPVGLMPRVHCGDASLLCEVGNMGTSQDQWEANAALIAGGLTTLPELFDRIEQLEAREKKMRDVLGYYAEIFCEFGKYHENCGRLRDDDCSGCKARVAGTRIAVGGPRGTSAASLIVEAYGDAVVPQIPEAIGRAILRVERAMAAILQPNLFAGRG